MGRESMQLNAQNSSRGQSTAWVSRRYQYSPSAVGPSSTSGAHDLLHQNVKDKYFPRKSANRKNGGVKTIAKPVIVQQRYRPHSFVGLRQYSKEHINETVTRLSKYDPDFQPPNSPELKRKNEKGNKELLCRPLSERSKTVVERLSQTKKQKGRPEEMPSKNKSFTAEEVQAVVDRLTTFDNNRWPAGSKTKDDLHSNNFELLDRIPKPPKDAPLGKQAEVIVERLSQYDKAKGPPESPYPKESLKRERTSIDGKVDVNVVVERLSKFDSKRYPPESKGSRESMIPPIIQPRWNPGSGRQCSQDEIQEIVDRLSKYDPTKGPPESHNKNLK